MAVIHSRVAVIPNRVAVIHSRLAVINIHEIFQHQILCIYDFSIQGDHLYYQIQINTISLTFEYWELSLVFKPPRATTLVQNEKLKMN